MKALSKEQQKFIKLAKKKEEIYEALDKLNTALEELMTGMGEGAMFQDPEDKTVYKIVKPTGRFVSFSQIDYRRTNRLGENRGGVALAKKEATEAGFEL